MLLTKIHKVERGLTISCNAGKKTTSLGGYLSGYGWVWYFPEGIANILSLSRVNDKYRITYDSATDNAFHMHKLNKIISFEQATGHLCYFDTAKRTEEGNLFVTTVADNKNEFSSYDYSQAKLASTIQRCTELSTPALVHKLKPNQMRNIPVTAQHVLNAEFIFGKNIKDLKGKTVWKQPA
mmetsp:Transcript_2297/g.3324  ORF Transcript_2297/g.3324 Transcript_2297/m.3324 type:complete len:181 (-) Transcript_2297:1781-2323(-)